MRDAAGAASDDDNNNDSGGATMEGKNLVLRITARADDKIRKYCAQVTALTPELWRSSGRGRLPRPRRSRLRTARGGGAADVPPPK